VVRHEAVDKEGDGLVIVLALVIFNLIVFLVNRDFS